jgi:hypothetical protein
MLLGATDCAADTPQSRAALQQGLTGKLRKKLARLKPKARKKRLAKLLRVQLAQRACTVTLPSLALDEDGVAGENQVELDGGGPLPPGSYHAVVTATDTAGNAAEPATIDFQVGP